MDAKKKSGGESSMPRSLQKINDRSASLKAELNSSHRGRGAKSRLSSHAEEDDNGADAKLKAQVKTLKEDLDRRQVRAYACSGVVAHPCDDSGSVPRAMQTGFILAPRARLQNSSEATRRGIGQGVQRAGVL